jgi:hypothetical protein
VSVGSGDRRRRASSARGPSPTSFGVLGLTRARQSFLAGAAAAKRSRTCSPSARHTSLTHHISRMRVRARHRCLQYAIGAAAEVLRAGERAEAQARQAEAQRREAGNGARAATIGGG